MTARALSTIADEISRSWAKPYFGAVPYLAAGASCFTFWPTPGHGEAMTHGE